VATEIAKKEAVVYTPSVGVRLLWWFGIYVAAQLPLAFSSSPFWAFPAGLAVLLLSSTAPSLNSLLPIGYVSYFVHLILSLTVRSKNFFRILMVILLVMVSLNLWSCKVLPTLGRVP
jgi:hypothetical protein